MAARVLIRRRGWRRDVRSIEDNFLMTDVCIVLTTVDDREKGRQLASEIVELRLAACVNIVDRIHSTYRWKGKVETAEELLLIFKTSRERLGELKAKIEGLHPYELPEILVFNVIEGSATYLEWIVDSCRMHEKSLNRVTD